PAHRDARQRRRHHGRAGRAGFGRAQRGGCRAHARGIPRERALDEDRGRYRSVTHIQPLSGILVLDFTTLLPGPLATLMLAEAGAEVIKIERPGGEDMRVMPPRFDGEAAVFALLNRGKKSLTLDLKNENDCRRLRPLLEKADVIVEQFRPGVMDRLNLGFEDIRKFNPRIVYCSISGYGQKGPRAGEAGHDINYQSLTGLLALQPGPIDRPVIPPALVADIGGGTMPAVINILLGLRQRDATGTSV